MSDCVFCDIVAGKAPASIVYQDDIGLAIMDIRPINPGQIVVMPKTHIVNMADIDEATWMHLFKITMRMMWVIRNSGVKCEGINLFLADGEAAGQEVFHLHILVFPRFKGDSLKINADWASPTRKELDEIAARIRSVYESLY